MCYIFFFFFKQKTAYEMRISDWSSDVCSSDLAALCAIAEELTQAPSSAAEQHDHNVLRVSNILRPRENTDKDGRMMCGSDSPRRRLSRASSRSLPYGQAGPRLYLDKPAARNDAPTIGRSSGRERVCPYV